jgi:hypothetical protein
MTVAKEKETELKKKPEKKTIWTTEERSNLQTLYGCDTFRSQVSRLGTDTFIP